MPAPEMIETPRLRLRRPVRADAPLLFERWAQDREVTRYLVWSPHEDVTEAEAHVQRCIDGWNAGGPFVWFIEERETGTLIGSIAARNEAHGVNVGYLLARDAWGRGYMTEALDAVAQWFLAQPGIERVWATCDVENTASARVLEKAGFEFEGVLRRWDIHPNISSTRRDARCYSRIR
jgi:RimJ/RimL family protein N-acetyltransferase